MKPTVLFFSTLLAAAVGFTAVANAQQAPAPPAQSGTHAGHGKGHGMARALQGIDLSDSQRTQIRSLMQQYRQAHPKGSQPDPQARKALRAQIMAVLTPDQQSRLTSNLQQMRAARRAAASPSPAP